MRVSHERTAPVTFESAVDRLKAFILYLPKALHPCNPGSSRGDGHRKSRAGIWSASSGSCTGGRRTHGTALAECTHNDRAVGLVRELVVGVAEGTDARDRPRNPQAAMFCQYPGK